MTDSQPILETAREYYERASEYFYEEEFDKAEADCTEAILRDETYREAWFLRGDIYSKTGKHGPAIENFMQALHLLSTEKHFSYGDSDRKAVILCRIANANLARGNLEEAIRNAIMSAELTGRYNDSCEPLYIQGMAWSKKGNPEEAIRCFDNAIAKRMYEDYHLDSLVERAKILRKLRRVAEALDDCNTALQHDSYHVEALIERVCLRKAETFEWSDKDLEDLRKAVCRRSKHPKALAMLADCLFGTGRLEEAGEAAVKALQMNPGNDEEIARLRNIMKATKRKKETREKNLPDHPSPFCLMLPIWVV